MHLQLWNNNNHEDDDDAKDHSIGPVVIVVVPVVVVTASPPHTDEYDDCDNNNNNNNGLTIPRLIRMAPSRWTTKWMVVQACIRLLFAIVVVVTVVGVSTMNGSVSTTFTHAWVTVVSRIPTATTTTTGSIVRRHYHYHSNFARKNRYGYLDRTNRWIFSTLHARIVDDDDDNRPEEIPTRSSTSSPPQTRPPQTKPSRFAQPQFQKKKRIPPPVSSTSSTPASTTTAVNRISSSSPPPPLPMTRSTTTTPNTLIDRDRMWKRPTTTTTPLSSKMSTKNNSNNNNNNNNNNNKLSGTIEDLEQRLMQRYGTDMSKWTSGEFDDDDDDDDEDDEIEYVDDDDDDDGNDINNYDINNPRSSNSQKSFSRSPSVFDPWDDVPQSSTTTTITGTDTDTDNDETVTNPALPSLVRDKITASLQASSKSSTKVKVSPLSAFGRRTDTSTQTPTLIDLSHLITKEPAGGRGTNAILPSTTARSTPTSKSAQSNLDEEDNSKTLTTTAVRSSTLPILDANGVPMLLTIEQAQHLFGQQVVGDVTTASSPTAISLMNNNVDDEDVKINSTWHDLGITNPILWNNLQRIHCEYPLPAQRTACPNIVSGTTDVIVGTYTGSGKTLAFLVPIIQRILQMQQEDSSVFEQKSGYVKLIIVAPGRELASQIATVTRTLLSDLDLSCMLAIGGTTFTRNLEQIRKRKPDILIGTPGRLAELMIGTTGSDIGGSNMKRGGRVPVNNVQAIVLDEFDALLSYPPHSDPVHALMEFMKRNRGNNVQTIMCSATASDMMMMQQKKGELLLEEKYLRPGYVFAVADADDILVTALNNDSDMIMNRNVTRTTRVSRTVMHGVIHVPHKRFALDTLRRILHTEPIPQQILIFVSDSRKVGIVVEKLADVGIIAAPLHGGMDSEKMDRAEVSRALREGYVGIVVSTEMAARGLDAPLLTHVINMDLPTDSSHYAHRAGRCGRGGRPGVVINLTTSPQERGVPIKLADQLGVKMYTVEVKNAKLNVVDPQSQILDGA